MAAQKQGFERLDWQMQTKNKMLFKIINYYEHHITALGLDKVYSVFAHSLPSNAYLRSIDPQGVESAQQPLPLFPEGTNSYTDDFSAAASGISVSTSNVTPSSNAAAPKGKGKEREMPPASQETMIPPPLPTYAQAAIGQASTSTKSKKGKKGKNHGSAASSVASGATSTQDQAEWLAGSISSLAITRPGSAFSASFNPGAVSYLHLTFELTLRS